MKSSCTEPHADNCAGNCAMFRIALLGATGMERPTRT